MSDSLWPHGLYRLFHPWDFPGKNTGVGCHFLLQGIFPTQGLNPGLPHSRQMLYCLSHPGSQSKEAPFSSNCLKDVLDVIFFFLIYMFENSWIFFFFIWLIVWVWIEFWGKKNNFPWELGGNWLFCLLAFSVAVESHAGLVLLWSASLLFFSWPQFIKSLHIYNSESLPCCKEVHIFPTLSI